MSFSFVSAAKPSGEELALLRKHGLSFVKLRAYEARDVAGATGITHERCRVLKALSEFQGLRSVGPSLSSKMVLLGYLSLEALAQADPSAMYKTFCTLVGRRVDPCVEDVFRCAVAQARYPDMDSEYGDWWNWTEHRGRSDVPHP